MSSRYAEFSVTGTERNVLNLAIEAVELVQHAELLGLIMHDDKGLFLHLRPGMEPGIARYLAGLDWDSVVRVAEEHSG